MSGMKRKVGGNAAAGRPRAVRGGIVSAMFAMVLALACCVCLAACNGDKYEHAGFYKLVEIRANDPDQSTTREQAAALDAIGLGTSLQLDDDGFGVFIMTGIPVNITWEHTTISLLGEADMDFAVEGDVLTMGSYGTVMVFEKQKPKEYHVDRG